MTTTANIHISTPAGQHYYGEIDTAYIPHPVVLASAEAHDSDFENRNALFALVAALHVIKMEEACLDELPVLARSGFTSAATVEGWAAHVASIFSSWVHTADHLRAMLRKFRNRGFEELNELNASRLLLNMRIAAYREETGILSVPLSEVVVEGTMQDEVSWFDWYTELDKYARDALVATVDDYISLRLEGRTMDELAEALAGAIIL